MSPSFADLEAFAGAYPESPAMIPHRLSDHPLLTIAALKALVSRMRLSDMLCCKGDVPVDAGPDGAPLNGRCVAETLDSIHRCGSWVVLKHVEQDPSYRMLMEDLLKEIEPRVRPLTGPMLQREAFVFISSPGATTPFHFDPEHNILMQIAGHKVVTVLPAGNEEIAPGPAHEAYHRSGTYGLRWRDEFSSEARAFTLRAGDALHVPVKAPHWVRNGSEVSISLSITWRSGWSLREGRAHEFNGLLRGLGLNPSAPRRFPADNRAKAMAYQCLRKAGNLVGVRP